jgi:hypothetical protein
MKKALAVALCAALALGALCACGQQAAAPQQNEGEGAEEENTAGQALTGGWEKAESPVITEEIRALLDKATAEMVGAEYEPVAYLGSQVVAGMNHAVLCRIRPVVPDAESSYAIVYIYKDLQDNAEITEIAESGVVSQIKEIPGGWFAAEDPTVTEELGTAFAAALEDLVGVDYEPLALLGSQVVAGKNYCFFCEATPVVPNAETGYAFVYVYQDLQGNAELSDIVNFGAAE